MTHLLADHVIGIEPVVADHDRDGPFQPFGDGHGKGGLAETGRALEMDRHTGTDMEEPAFDEIVDLFVFEEVLGGAEAQPRIGRCDLGKRGGGHRVSCHVMIPFWRRWAFWNIARIRLRLG